MRYKDANFGKHLNSEREREREREREDSDIGIKTTERERERRLKIKPLKGKTRWCKFGYRYRKRRSSHWKAVGREIFQPSHVLGTKKVFNTFFLLQHLKPFFF